MSVKQTKILPNIRKTEKKIMPKIIFPLRCMESTPQTPKSVPDVSCIKCAIMSQIKKISIYFIN